MPQKTEIRIIPFEGKMISYELVRKNVKNINLRIKPEGTVHVSAHRCVPVKYIDSFVASKGEVICSALETFKEKQKDTPKRKEYVDGEHFSVMGQDLILMVAEGAERVEVRDGFLYLRVKDKANIAQKQKAVEKWMRNLAKQIFEEISQEIYPLFQPYGVTFPLLKMRTMRARWGSCHYNKGTIVLNTRLIEAPRESIEYVVLHEYAHFIHPNHSKAFYDLVAGFMPDWKERKKRLNQINLS